MKQHLRPGEAFEIAGDLLVRNLDGTVAGLSAGITAERLYTFGWKKSWRGELQLVTSNSLLLGDLSSVSHARTKSFLHGEKVSIELRWRDGRYDHLFTQELEFGEAFFRALRDGHDRSGRASAGAPSIAEELARLGELKGQGLLSEDDWERAKNLFLGKPPDQRAESIENLRQLHALFRAGVLSESEFNSKKWDVLSRSSG